MTAPARVQSGFGSPSFTFGSNVTAGDLLVAFVDSQSVSPTPSDGQNNVWVLFQQFISSVPSRQSNYSVYYAVAKSTGALTVSVPSDPSAGLAVVEYSASAGPSIDVVSKLFAFPGGLAAFPAFGNIQSPAFTPLFATERIVGWLGAHGVDPTTGPCSSFLIDPNIGLGHSIAVESQAVASASPISSCFIIGGVGSPVIGENPPYVVTGAFGLVAQAFPTVTGNVGAPGVTVNLTAVGVGTSVVSMSTVSDGSGNYSFSVPSDTYMVTPVPSPGQSFVPQNKNVTVAGSSQSGVNFTLTSNLKKSTRFSFKAITLRNGDPTYTYQVIDGSPSYGMAIGQITWDGANARWGFTLLSTDPNMVNDVTASMGASDSQQIRDFILTLQPLTGLI